MSKMTSVSPRMSVSDRYDEDIDFDRPPYANPLFIIDALREEIGEEAWPTHPQNPLWGTELYTSPYITAVELGMRVAARTRRDQETGVEVAAEAAVVSVPQRQTYKMTMGDTIETQSAVEVFTRRVQQWIYTHPHSYIEPRRVEPRRVEEQTWTDHYNYFAELQRYYEEQGSDVEDDPSGVDDPDKPGRDKNKAVLRWLNAVSAAEAAIVFMSKRQKMVIKTEAQKPSAVDHFTRQLQAWGSYRFADPTDCLAMIDAMRKEVGEEAWPTHRFNPLLGRDGKNMQPMELEIRRCARDRQMGLSPTQFNEYAHDSCYDADDGSASDI